VTFGILCCYALDIAMQNIYLQQSGLRRSEDDWSDEDAQDLVRSIVKFAPYLFRITRVFAYGVASYLLLWIQPHYTFSFAAMAFGLFLLATVKRTTIITEVALAVIVASVFHPSRNATVPSRLVLMSLVCLAQMLHAALSSTAATR
jgi:hypothetical protein